MLQVFAKSCKGYSHLKSHKPCQDFSLDYKDNERTIITCCDGHGGDIYVRSDRGSYLASCAILNVFRQVDTSNLKKYSLAELINKIRLEVLCEWNKLVEKELSLNPIRSREVQLLDQDKKDLLKMNPVKAYGTTLAGAMILKNNILVISIGDTEVIGIKDGQINKLLDNEDDPAGNITYSMCQEDAYDYLRANIYDLKEYDGILLCTDGMSSPYQNYDNFNKSFIKPLMNRVIRKEALTEIDSFVDELGTKVGNGDDVSLAFIVKDTVKRKYYK